MDRMRRALRVGLAACALAGVSGCTRTAAGSGERAAVAPAHAARASRFPRAQVLPEHVDSAAAIETRLAARYDAEPAPGERWFSVLPGRSRVLVVAGHATAQTREGGRKGPDSGTGSLAVMLHRLTGATALHTTHRSPSDPNYYDDNAFKAELARLLAEEKPALVVDLHASDPRRPYDVDFGTMGNGASLLGQDAHLVRLAEGLRREGLVNLSQDFFPAARQATVTKWVAARGVPAVQLEISAVWLRPGDDPAAAHRYAQLLQALVRFIAATDSAAGR